MGSKGHMEGICLDCRRASWSAGGRKTVWGRLDGFGIGKTTESPLMAFILHGDGKRGLRLRRGAWSVRRPWKMEKI